ncbi:MAG: hypothetical protein AB7S46_18070 [Flavobacteriaceae bacterium]
MSGRTRLSVFLDLAPAMLLLGVLVFAGIATANWSDLVCTASEQWMYGAFCDAAAPAEAFPAAIEPMALEDSNSLPAPAAPQLPQGADAAGAAP